MDGAGASIHIVRVPRQRSLVTGALLSLAIHAAVALLLVRLPSAAVASLNSRPERGYDVELETHGPGTVGATARGHRPTDAERAVAGGVRSAQNIDAPSRGEGGDAHGAREGILLMHRDDGILFFDSPLNNVAAAQSQRIRTARDRATLERRRATPNPNDDPFLASGSGRFAERRPIDARDPTEGARRVPTASAEGAQPSVAEPGLAVREAEGGVIGDRAQPAPLRRASAASDDASGSVASPGAGILRAHGTRRSEAAPVAHGRPPVDRGPAATQAESVDSRVRDRTDAELLAASMMQRWVESTTRTGPAEGVGRGGVGGGGAPGSGSGRGEGGRASAHGPGDGRHSALDTSDGRYRRWFLDQRRRVHDALRFPHERALAMDQGVSIYTVVVRRDGTLVSAPQLTRSSGFHDMDRAALSAIAAATPFSPLPTDLAPELEQIRIRLPIEFSNPMVR